MHTAIDDHSRLINLLSKAIKYNRTGGGVDITVEAVTGTEIGISVKDSGIGIPAADLPRLFNPFDWLGRQSFNIEGTGIGLSLSKRLVTLMGGQLQVETTAGVGSTFTVILPQAATPKLNRPHQRAAHTICHTTVVSTLLYLEDKHTTVDLVTVLTRYRPNWTVTPAGNGKGRLDVGCTPNQTAVPLELKLSGREAAGGSRASSHATIATLLCICPAAQILVRWAAAADRVTHSGRFRWCCLVRTRSARPQCLARRRSGTRQRSNSSSNSGAIWSNTGKPLVQ